MNPGRAQATGPDREAAQTPGTGTAAADPIAASGAPDLAVPGTVSKRTAAAILSRLRAPGSPAPAADVAPPRRRRRAAAWHLLLLGCFIAAGIGVTWPMTAKLADGQLLWNPDIASYVWALWWMAHQVAHLGNPFATTYMAAPVGIQLGFDTLMPLPGLIMTPVTLVWGPAASFAVLTIITPGVLCYAAYRAARLWLGQPGAIAAGALFGLSTMVTWQNLYHLNISIGTIFLPLTLEAAIRLRRASGRPGRTPAAAPQTPGRNPGRRQAIVLGVVLGASVLTNQESAVLAVLLAIGVLLPWLIRLAIKPGIRRTGPQLRTLVLGAVVAVVVASPQLAAMIGQAVNGGTNIVKGTMYQLTQSYGYYGVGLPTLFSPSPRLAHFHLGQLASAYHYTQPGEGRPTFGVVLAGLALLGLILSWRRGHSWWLALLWLVGAALALGPTLVIGTKTYVPLATTWHGVRVSQLMPYSWLIRIPGLSALREADRLALLGLLGAAILAGTAIQWLWEHVRPILASAVIVVLAAGAFLEVGWAEAGATMPATMPTVDRGIATDHTRSIVVDLPLGLRGGVGLWGFPLPPPSLVMATADGHPRAVSYTSWVPLPTLQRFTSIPFYKYLHDAESGAHFRPRGPAMVLVRHSAGRINVGWIVVWRTQSGRVRKGLVPFLFSAGFRPRYEVTNSWGTITVWKRMS